MKREIPKNVLIDKLKSRIIGESRAHFKALTELARVIPNEDLRVLIVGESGTGKELMARAIHDFGPQKDKPWVAVSLAERSPTLIESELFGHEKGSFTGASDRKTGRLEEAGDGILFLDEIGDLQESLQVKLLRVIQEKKFRRLGGKEDIPFRARLVTATNHDLSTESVQNKFRSDLYHRISEYQIKVPPLRERKDDIPLLVEHFLKKLNMKKEMKVVRETEEILKGYSFPGNIRELENMVKRFQVVVDGDLALPSHLPLEEMNNMDQIHGKDDN